MSWTRPENADDKPPFVKPSYCYPARVIKVVDGDTIDVEIDVGFDTWVKKRLRFLLVDAWEKRYPTKEAGAKAWQELKALLMFAGEVWVQTIMDSEGKFGRVLAWVYVEHGGELLNVNQWLIEQGHGEIYT